jgi:hypothetical protein
MRGHSDAFTLMHVGTERDVEVPDVDVIKERGEGSLHF